jgi:hypothetical protein
MVEEKKADEETEPDLRPIIHAVLPANNPELFGETGPTAENFRYSRTQQKFVLKKEDDGLVSEDSLTAAETIPMNQPGIMQQVNLVCYEQLEEEIAFMQRRHPEELNGLYELIVKFHDDKRLVGTDLSDLRTGLEQYVMKRPTGSVMEVRDRERSRVSFMPHQHENGIWYISGKGSIGADPRGVFFRNKKNEEYFCSTNFRQTRLDRFEYELEDIETGTKAKSPIAICDVWYQDPKAREMTSGLLNEVVFEQFNFNEPTGKLAFALHTIAKLGVITGTPLLWVICPSERYLAFDG